MDIEDVFQCLCKWVTFVKQSPSPVSMDCLVTGHAFAEVLHIIDPCYFDENWRDSIKAAVNSSSYWRIKAFALRRLMKSLLKYSAEVCNNPIMGRIIPDVTLIARDNSLPELVKFMQLLVASAVHGPKGKEMIEAILTLEESIQQTIMLSIKELETSKGKCEPITPDEEKQAMFEELNDALQSHENIAAHCVQLETQLAEYAAEKQSLLSKIASLTQQLQASSLSFEELRKESSSKVAQLGATIKTLEMEMAKSENSRDMLSYELEQLQKELWDCQMRGTSKSEDQSRKAKDEIDELRAKAADADTFSEQVVNLKKKLEAVGDLRSQIKVLEEKNASLVANLVQSEEEQRKSAARKVQLETLKMKLQQAELKAEEEARKAVQFELELRKVTEKEAAMTQERDRLMQERKTLQDTVDELQCRLLETSTPSGIAQSSLEVGPPGADMDTVMALVADAPVEIKQKLIQLYQENRLLRLRLANEKETTIDSEASQNICAGERAIPASSVATKSTAVPADETEVNFLKSQIEKLTAELEAKEEQIKQDKKVYYDNLEKARRVIYALNTAVKCGADTNYTISDIEAMKASIAQKESMIEDMQESFNRSKIMYEQEERLITTAFHELAWQLHRKAGEERLAIAFGEEPPTFLNQQRQLSMTKLKAAGDTYANHTYRWLTVLLALVFVSAACSSDTWWQAIDCCVAGHEFNEADIFQFIWMNILPKKRWHVRTKENVAKVRKDEAAAAAEERARMARAALAEQEARTKFLISRLGNEAATSSDQTDKEQRGHLNLFDEGGSRGGIFGVNPEAEAEKKQQREREERRIGLLRYLGEGSMEYMKQVPWYEQVPERFKNRDHPPPPPTSAANATTTSHDEEERNRQKTKEAEKRKKRKKHPPTMEELRAERLKRERVENARSERLLKDRTTIGSQVAAKEKRKGRRAHDFKQKYSSQFNPVYAKQNLR